MFSKDEKIATKCVWVLCGLGLGQLSDIALECSNLRRRKTDFSIKEEKVVHFIFFFYINPGQVK